MTGDLLDKRELISSLFIIAGIILHLLNKQDLRSWLISYCPLLIFGFWGLVSELMAVSYSHFFVVNILILAWFLMVNRNNWGLNFNILGGLTNMVVIWTNGGRMPFLPGFGAEDSSYSFIGPDTNLSFFFGYDFYRPLPDESGRHPYPFGSADVLFGAAWNFSL